MRRLGYWFIIYALPINSIMLSICRMISYNLSVGSIERFLNDYRKMLYDYLTNPSGA